jgi:hypothetical protein
LPSSRRKPPRPRPRPPSPPLRPPPTSASALSVDPLATRFVNITSNKQKGITDIFKVTKAKAKARTTKLRYFLTTEQLSEVIESHDENNLSHEWVKGDFSFAAKGEVIPTGSLEMLIKVPSGLDFLVFPRILKLERGVEEEEEEEEHESDSELSECGYVSDIHN